jgi:tetratricopeptide (TPR) repeat protein
LGIAYEDKGFIDEAIEQFQIALTLNPTDPDARSQLAKAYEMKNLADKAKNAR